MNAVALVTVPLSDLLEEMGLDEVKVDRALNFFSDYLEDEDQDPGELTDITCFVNDDEFLKGGLRNAKIDKVKFDAILAKISSENNDLPVYVTL